MRKLFLGLLALLGGLSATGYSSNGVDIYFSNNKTPIRVTNVILTLSQALKNEGLKVSEIKNNFEPSIPWDSKLIGNSRVDLQEKPKVTLIVRGKNKGVFPTSKQSVAQFLKKHNVTLSKCDKVKVSLDTVISKNMKIQIDRLEKFVREKSVSIPFDVRQEIDTRLPNGTKKVKVNGKPGKDIYEVEETYLNGKLLMKNGKPVISKKKIRSIKPITKVVLVGMDGSFSELTVQTTAYSYTGSRTATGTKPKRGTIAVDPRIIPLGTKLYIPGYGYGIAEDTGGAIKGRIIDLFFHSRAKALQWGRRTVTIKIVR